MISIFYSMTDLSASTKNCLKTTEAFSDNFDVGLLSTFSDFDILTDYFGIDQSFEYKRRGIGVNNNYLLEVLDRLSFSILSYIKVIIEDPDIVYTRDTAFLAFLAFLPHSSVLAFECHKLLDENKKFPTFLQDYALKKSDAVFCVSNGVKKDVEEKVDDKENVFLQRNCVDIEKFEELSSPSNTTETTLTYIGTFKESKDIKTLIRAFKELDDRYHLKLIGPEEDKIQDEISGLVNAELKGFMSEEEIITEIEETDILVYTSDKSPHQQRYTSPMKLFEYMASKRPVIAADLPTVREIASDSVRYYEPEDPLDLAEQIREVDEKDEIARVSYALEIVKSNYTWDAKAKFIAQKIS